MLAQESSHWLAQYGSDCYRWQKTQRDGRTTFYRPLGLVEVCFDADGRYFEGRADINVKLDLAIDSKLSKKARQDHITTAWACLRARHILASAKAPSWQPWMDKPVQIIHKHCFQVEVPVDADDAIRKASDNIVFVEDTYAAVNARLFYTQAQNATRRLDPEKALSSLVVLPVLQSGDKTTLTCVFTAAHQIGDGLSVGRWIPDFTRLLNLTTEQLSAELKAVIEPQQIERILPLPQEALYPAINGNRARQRWFWVLTRILRHVRKPLPAGFANPLLKVWPNEKPQRTRPPAPIPKLWDKLLDYRREPLNRSTPCAATMSLAATARMARICKDASVSIGAGCFALAAILMMEFYQRREPDLPLDQRKPFITGFPLNPRPFLNGNPSADSLMLAFSDGILMPFLPASLNFEGRLRLLAKTAQRQLAIYQKRTSIRMNRTGLQYMSSRGAGRVLQIQYLSSFERCEAMMPEEARTGINPQGAYLMRPNMTRQTCGVSSLGKRPSLNTGVQQKNPDFIATAIDMLPTVRPRDGEFLIGVSGTDEGIAVGISVDATSMDPYLVEEWLQRFKHILDEDASKL